MAVLAPEPKNMPGKLKVYVTESVFFEMALAMPSIRGAGSLGCQGQPVSAGAGAADR
jgi:hypothetical protein